MKLNRCNGGMEITIGDGEGLSARRRATVEHARAAPHESGDELRGFVLNHAEARSESGSSRDVSVPNLSSRGEESAGSQFDSFAAEVVFRFRMTKTDCCHGHRLILPANLPRGFESIGLRPAFDEPQRMSTAGGECLGRGTLNRGWRSVEAWRSSTNKFTQHSIDEWSGRTFAGALD